MSRINIRFLTGPDVIVISSSPTIYFVENQLQENSIANGIVKNRRKYSCPANIGAKQAPKTMKKIGYNHTSFLMEIPLNSSSLDLSQ